jgi:hypothetical protein
MEIQQKDQVPSNAVGRAASSVAVTPAPADVAEDIRQDTSALPDTEAILGRHDAPPPPDPDDDEAPPSPGLSLQGYAAEIRLPVEFLTSLGLSQIHYNGQAAVKVPYLDQSGREVGARFMVRDHGSEHGIGCVWKKGVKPIPYGLWRLHEAAQSGHLVIVNDEIDSHVLWHYGVASLAVADESVRGLVECMEALPGIKKIAVLRNGDGTEHALRLLAKSSLKSKVSLVTLPEQLSIVGIHLRYPGSFRQQAKASSKSCTFDEYEAEIRQRRMAELWDLCKDTASQPSILDAFAADLEASGIVGEERLAKLLYLAVTSRLLNRPVSVAVKGQSSCGKSVTTQGVLKFFPPSACHALSSMSEKALLYSPEPFEHRMLVVYELDGVRSKFGTYILRTLLSENRISYEVTVNVGGEHTTHLIEKEGPTGLIITTTLPRWHEENETRMVSVNVDESAEQTKRVLNATAVQDRPEVDMDPWHALQEWLGLAERRVVVPFANEISALMPADLPPRIRRDFPALLSLIKAHAILHQVSRPRDEDGWITATLGDYAVVRELVADLMAQGVESTVPKTVRETVTAVKALSAAYPAGVSEPVVATELGLHKGTVSRRLNDAAAAGFLKNLEPKLGRPARWVLGSPLPDDMDILPTVEQLADAVRCCSPNP